MPYLVGTKPLKPMSLECMRKSLATLKAIDQLERKGFLGRITLKMIEEQMRENKSRFHPGGYFMIKLAYDGFVNLREHQFFRKGGEAKIAHLWSVNKTGKFNAKLLYDSLEYYHQLKPTGRRHRRDTDADLQNTGAEVDSEREAGGADGEEREGTA